jgi:ABC-type oligopeptide transport system substrate-binding subunit
MFKRFLSIFVILILTCSLLVACGASDENNKQSEEQNRQSEEISDDPNTPPVLEEKHSGIYQGQIDNNSIEIKVTNGAGETLPQAFQLSEEIKEDFDSYKLEIDDKISFTYDTPEIGNPIITKIEKVQ